jgi:hypothetical protein
MQRAMFNSYLHMYPWTPERAPEHLSTISRMADSLSVKDIMGYGMIHEYGSKFQYFQTMKRNQGRTLRSRVNAKSYVTPNIQLQLNACLVGRREWETLSALKEINSVLQTRKLATLGGCSIPEEYTLRYHIGFLPGARVPIFDEADDVLQVKSHPKAVVLKRIGHVFKVKRRM